MGDTLGQIEQPAAYRALYFVHVAGVFPPNVIFCGKCVENPNFPVENAGITACGLWGTWMLCALGSFPHFPPLKGETTALRGPFL